MYLYLINYKKNNDSHATIETMTNSKKQVYASAVCEFLKKINELPKGNYSNEIIFSTLLKKNIHICEIVELEY